MVAAICAEMPSLGERGDGPAGLHEPGARRTSATLPAATLCRLFSLSWRFDLEREADETAAFLIRRPDLVPPDRTLPVLLEALRSAEGAKAETGFAFAALWRHAADCLLSRSESPPRPPADRAIPADGLSCDCEDCVELRRFCADPDAEVHRMPVRKALRAHLRRQIEYAGVDIRCETERRGSPHTLVCVKTRATYERRLRQYREDVVEMRRLAAAADAVPDPSAIGRRHSAARSRNRAERARRSRLARRVVSCGTAWSDGSPLHRPPRRRRDRDNRRWPVRRTLPRSFQQAILASVARLSSASKASSSFQSAASRSIAAITSRWSSTVLRMKALTEASS